jgi:cytochrome bd-type quinol oxidase subunit 1
MISISSSNISFSFSLFSVYIEPYIKINKMHLTLASILTAAAFIGAASACPGHHGYHGHESHNAPKGKTFDHILQIWFENQVRLS